MLFWLKFFNSLEIAPSNSSSEYTPFSWILTSKKFNLDKASKFNSIVTTRQFPKLAIKKSGDKSGVKFSVGCENSI